MNRPFRQPTRREFLQAMLAAGGLVLVPGLSFAGVRSQRKLAVVILRGAMDGLAAVPPMGDAHYATVRGDLALPREEVLDLDGYFGLHPALRGMEQLYRRKELLVLHACASPYRDRSHFDAQDLLENGTDRAHALRSGWLNRALSLVNGQGGRVEAVGLGGGVPLVLRGELPVQSFSLSGLPRPGDAFLERVLDLYQGDRLLHQSLERALQGPAGMDRRRRKGDSFLQLARTAGRMLQDPAAPDLAVLELNGWDTHARQGAGKGSLARVLGRLDAGLSALRKSLGSNWQQTAVLIITEFGRTVRQNGTGGTDHGTASAAFLAGGLVRGGQVIGDWPGLSEASLYQGRDLYPANDLRAFCKGVLHETYRLSSRDLDRVVFPGSAKAGMLSGLLR